MDNDFICHHNDDKHMVKLWRIEFISLFIMDELDVGNHGLT